MGFFAKSSLIFVTVNVVRVLSIVAILLAFSGNIVVMVHDLKGLETTSASTPSLLPSSTNTSIASLRVKREYSSALLVQGVPLSETTPTSTASMTRSTSVAAQASTRATALAAATASTTTTTATSSPSTCAYLGNTSIPRTVGGPLFATLNHIFCCIVLLFMLMSEMPPPAAAIDRFWTYAFPPFGQDFGTGTLGVVQVFVGSTMLSHALPKFPQVSGWFLFILGFINILFGLALGAAIKSIRSILSTPTAPSGLRSLRLAQQEQKAAEGGHYYAHHDPERVDEAEGRKPKKYAGKRGIQISAPMIQVPEPPVYR